MGISEILTIIFCNYEAVRKDRMVLVVGAVTGNYRFSGIRINRSKYNCKSQ